MKPSMKKTRCCNAEILDVKDKEYTRFVCQACRKYVDYVKNKYPLAFVDGKWKLPKDTSN